MDIYFVIVAVVVVVVVAVVVAAFAAVVVLDVFANLVLSLGSFELVLDSHSGFDFELG